MIGVKHSDTFSDAEGVVIVRELLERTGAALKSGNFETFAPCFALPYSVETFEGQQTVRTKAALQRLFNNSVSYYRDIGVTEMIRRPLETHVINATKISTVYETQLVHFDKVMQRVPYMVLMEIIKSRGAWRCVAAHYAIADSPAHGKVLLDIQ